MNKSNPLPTAFLGLALFGAAFAFLGRRQDRPRVKRVVCRSRDKTILGRKVIPMSATPWGGRLKDIMGPPPKGIN